MDVANADGLASQEFVSVALRLASDVTAASPLSISLAWTDYQGSLPSQKALVNDLDLIVSVGKTNTGSATVHRGGGGNLPDTRNNAEKVLLSALAVAGDVVHVNVSAWSVPTGRQGFALVIVGYFNPTSVSVFNSSNALPPQDWNSEHTFLRMYLNVSYKLLTDDASALQLLQSALISSVATLVRCNSACVHLSSFIRDQRLRSATGCSVDVSFLQCAVASPTAPSPDTLSRLFLTLLSGFSDQQSMFYQLDGLSSVTAVMTPEQAAAVRTVDDSSQPSTDLTVAVIALSVVVILLIGGFSVYAILRRMQRKVKVAPAPPEPPSPVIDTTKQSTNAGCALFVIACYLLCTIDFVPCFKMK